MRTKEELNGPEFRTDLATLSKMLTELKMEHVYQEHRGAAEKKVLELIGYFPGGTHQIIIDGISIIRGMVSFGHFELYSLYNSKLGDNPVRYATEEEVITALTNLK